MQLPSLATLYGPHKTLDVQFYKKCGHYSDVEVSVLRNPCGFRLKTFILSEKLILPLPRHYYV